MLEMQPKWKIERIKKIDSVACVAGIRKGGVGGSKILTCVESIPGTKIPPATQASKILE